MKERKKRRRFRIRHVLILIIAIYIGSTLISQQKLISSLKNEKIEKQKEIEKLNREVKDIEEKIQYTDSLEYIEKIAREELKMIMPDEVIYIDKNKNKDKLIKGIGN